MCRPSVIVWGVINYPGNSFLIDLLNVCLVTTSCWKHTPKLTEFCVLVPEMFVISLTYWSEFTETTWPSASSETLRALNANIWNAAPHSKSFYCIERFHKAVWICLPPSNKKSAYWHRWEWPLSLVKKTGYAGTFWRI